MPAFYRLILGSLLCVLTLSACQLQAPATAEPAPTNTPAGAPAGATEATTPAEPTAVVPTNTPAPTATPQPTATSKPTNTPMPTATPTETPAATPAPTETPTATPAPTKTATPVVISQPPAPTLPSEQVVADPGLKIYPDEAPAPAGLTVIVSANRELSGYRYKVSGLVRNDSDQPYAGLGIIATFFRSDTSRYGPERADMQCPILGPGDVCPFIVEAIDKNLTDVMLHPEGHPTDRRQPIPVTLTQTGRYVDSIGYVHITGSVSNPNPVPVQDITINGALLDNGEIVSLGTDLIVGPVDPNASAPFDVLIQYVPYTGTQLYVQALPPR